MEPTPDEIERACERACGYRRRIAIAAGQCSPRNAHEVVEWTAGVPERHPDGRWQVGWVSDSTVGAVLAVYWYPVSDVVGVEDPDVEPELPSYEDPPIATRGEDGRIATSFRYVYSYQGQDYDAEDAEDAINRFGGPEGWTWRRVG